MATVSKATVAELLLESIYWQAKSPPTITCYPK
jgi:hypothetical protein